MTRKYLSKIAALAATGIMALGIGTASAQDKPYDGVTIRVLSTQQPWDTETQKRVSAFEEATGATVEYDLYAFGQAVQKIAVELSTGSPAYDVFFLEASDVSRFAAAGRLSPLDDAIASKNFDVDDFIPSTTTAFTYDGKLMGIPYFAATQLYYWNGPMVEEAGLTAPPETWEDMLTLCGALKDKGVAPCTAMRGKPSTSENIWYWTQIMLGEGGNWVKDFPTDMTPTVNSPAAIKATELYANLLNNYGIPGSVSAGYDEVVVAMQQGNVPMVVEGAPLAGRILDPKLSKVVGKVGFAPPPGGPAGNFAPFTAQGYAVGAASRNVDAAKAFVLWATSRDTVLDIATNSSFLAVTRSSVWSDPAFIKAHGYDFGYGMSFTEAYSKALEQGAPTYRLPIPEFREMGDRVGLALQQVVTGEKSAKDALDDAQADVEKLLTRAGYLR